MGNNWETWLTSGLRIVLILAIAFTVRFLIRRAITRLISRLNREDRDKDRHLPLLRGGLLHNPERRRQRSETIGSVLRSAASVLVLGTAGLMILSELGVQLGPLMASAGIAGVAIGFGARSLVADVLSGLFMLLEDQYGVGDTIDVGEASGTVVEIGLRVTTLRGADGELWYVRNGEIKRVGNLSQGWSTATVDLTLAADADLEQVRKVVTAVGEEMSETPPWNEMLWEPVEVPGLESLGAESMVVRATAKTQPGQSEKVERELRWRLKAALDAAGIRQHAAPAPASTPAAPAATPATPVPAPAAPPSAAAVPAAGAPAATESSGA
jgi:small conductance mechanosensitive channel